MNPTTIIGIFVGFGIVFGTVWLTAEDILTFLNLPGLLIVLGGTIAATIVSYPPRYVWRVWANFVSAIRNERVNEKRDVDEIVEIVKIWRQGHIQKVEEKIEQIQSPFLQTGLRLIIDSTPAEDVLELLQWRIARLRAKEFAEADVFKTMGNYAPAFGMVGTLIGLVNMLFNMNTENLDQIGMNMALALITTFYGLILGNLLFKPIATKLEDRTERRVRTLGMALEAVILVSRRRSPVYIRETLYSFLTKYDDEVFKGAKVKERAK
jgi:chemotaxis protein MotA